jgi:hypothetical protein
MDKPNRLKTKEIHERIIFAIGKHVEWAGPTANKPLELDLASSYPVRLRIYAYNLTHPPGGRTLGEHKIQLIVPTQDRGERGDFDHTGGRIALLCGYDDELNVFVIWDSGMYPNFPYSCNVQVNAETVYSAYAGQLSTQERVLRSRGTEIVVASRADRFFEAIKLRMELSLKRLLDI